MPASKKYVVPTSSAQDTVGGASAQPMDIDSFRFVPVTTAPISNPLNPLCDSTRSRNIVCDRASSTLSGLADGEHEHLFFGIACHKGGLHVRIVTLSTHVGHVLWNLKTHHEILIWDMLRDLKKYGVRIVVCLPNNPLIMDRFTRGEDEFCKYVYNVFQVARIRMGWDCTAKQPESEQVVLDAARTHLFGPQTPASDHDLVNIFVEGQFRGWW